MTDFIAKSREAAAQGDTFAAYRLVVSAAEAEPENADAWYTLGCLLHEFKKYTAAAAAFRRANGLRPGHHETLVNLGLNLGLVGRFGEANHELWNAVGAAPKASLGHIHLANTLHTLGDPESTVRARIAVELEPESVLAHMILAFCLMTGGQWREGLVEYEWRFQYKLPEFLTAYPYPIWRGEETGTLVIAAEQGLGDNIQMMRYIPAAARRAERVVWLCQTEMFNLAQCFAAKNITRPIEIIPYMPTPARIPPGDAFIPTMSLPVALGIESIEEIDPYLEVRQSVQLYPTMQVGLAWAGSATHDNARHRDIPLEDLLPLTELPGIDFYSLQVGPARVQLDELGAHGLVRDVSGSITNFMDTAHLITRMDLVITVDTAVAHLAGAMGKECWMLVNQRARDWRWGRTGEKTPWYPSMRIISRPLEAESWKSVVSLVHDLLKERTDG